MVDVEALRVHARGVGGEQFIAEVDRLGLRIGGGIGRDKGNEGLGILQPVRPGRPNDGDDVMHHRPGAGANLRGGDPGVRHEPGRNHYI